MGLQGKNINDIKVSIQESYDSTEITPNRDGNLFERNEFIIENILNELPYQLVQSPSIAVSINTFGSFYTQIYDINGNPYEVSNIDISSATPLLYQSRGGGEFTTEGITQPELTKDLGIIEIFYNFSEIEWQADDLYKLEIKNVYITNEETIKLRTIIWSNIVSVVNDIDVEIDAIVTYLAPPDTDSSNNITIAEMIGRKGDTPKTNTTASVINILKSLVASQIMRRCNISNVVDATHFQSNDFPTAGTGTFNGWYVYVHQDNDGDVPPRGEYQLISDWNSETSTFTHTAFSVSLTTGNKILIINPNFYKISEIKDIVSNLPDGGLLTSLAQDSTVAKATSFNIPSQNSSNNTIITEVVGNKTDDESGNSLYSLTYISNKHAHSTQKVYPTLANGITLTTSTTTWNLGNFIEIVPINTITNIFDIHWINIGVVSANATFELILYSGTLGNEVEIGSARFSRVSNQAGTSPIAFQTDLIPANSRISGKLACSVSGANTTVISVFYHTY